MSKKTQYSDYVVLRSSGEVFKLKHPYLWDSASMIVVESKKRVQHPCPKGSVVRIPNNFTAYVKSDTASHGLKGTTQILQISSAESREHFYKSTELSGIWFEASNKWIPFQDIELSALVIPPMPSLEELEKCLIEFEGRKTILTYCDAFIGEAVCHPDDEFKVETGIAIAYNRAKEAKDKHDAILEKEKKIKVGDVVRVIDTRRAYSVYIEKVIKICREINALHLCTKYVYGEMLMNSKDRFDLFNVLGIDGDVAYIQNKTNQKCRLINMKGLSKAAPSKFKSFADILGEEEDWG